MVDPASLSSAIAMTLCFILSEVLPFISTTPVNGVIQGIVLGVSRFASQYTRLPDPPAAERTVQLASSSSSLPVSIAPLAGP
jgi:hypothetical protein